MHYKTLCMDWHTLNLTATFESAQMSPAIKKRRTYLKRYNQMRTHEIFCYLFVLYTWTLQFVLCVCATEAITRQRGGAWYQPIQHGQHGVSFCQMEEQTVCQEDKRSAISWRSNLFWAASITPLHSAFTRTSLMIAAACPVGSSDVLLSMNICTTLRQSIKLFY